MTIREDLIRKLSQAAEFEHMVTCQYLFAAFSLKTFPFEGKVNWSQLETIREWKTSLFVIARQEMEHMGYVSNLLTAVGGAPHFHLPPFPITIPFLSFPFPFELRRFDETTLERMIAIEGSHDAKGDQQKEDQQKGDQQKEDQQKEKQEGSVASLYEKIQTGLKSLEKTSPLSMLGEPASQVGNEEMELPPGHFDINLTKVRDLASGARGINRILNTGSGQGAEDSKTHYDVLLQIREEWAALKKQDPHFEPSRGVAANPTLESILHPLSGIAATLFNRSFELMNLMLTRFFQLGELNIQEQVGLRRTVFFPLMTMVLRPLGEILTLMPLEKEGELRAGAPFAREKGPDLSINKKTAWLLLDEQLQQLAQSGQIFSEALGEEQAAWAEPIQERARFLAENLVLIQRNFDRMMQLSRTKLGQSMQKLGLGELC